MAQGKEIRAGGGYVTLDVRNRLAKGLRAASSQLKAFGASMTATGAMVAGAGLAIAGPIMAAVGTFTRLGSEVADASARTGASTEILSELGHAAEMSGSSLGALEKGFAGLSKRLDKADGLSTATEAALAKTGLTLEQLQGMNVEQRFYAVADALAQVEDVSQRAAIAEELMGRAGRELLPVLSGGAAGLDEMRAHARGLGLTIGGDAAASADDLGDKLDELWKQLKMVAFTIGATVADDLIAFFQATQPVIRSVMDWIKENRGLIAIIFRVGAALVAVGGVLMGLGMFFTVAGTAIGGLVPILGFILSPIGLIVTALALAGVAFFGFTKTGRGALQSILDALAPFVAIVKKTFGGMFDAIAAGNWQLAGKILIAGLRLALVQGFGQLAAWLDGSMGDLLGKVVSQLAAGDLSGAWETIVLQMAAIWDGFMEGLIAVFTTISRAVVGVWSKTVQKLTNLMIDFDPTGTFAKQHAVAVEQARQSLPALERERKMLVDDIAKVQGGQSAESLGHDAGTTLEDLQRRLEGNADGIHRAQMAMGQSLSEFKDQSQAVANSLTVDTEAGLRERLDGMDRKAQEQARTAQKRIKDRTAGGVEATGKAADEAQAELDALVKQAAEQKQAVDEARRRSLDDAAFGLPAEEDIAAAGKAETRGTFSGFAANLVAGASKRPSEERMAKGIEGMAADTKKLAKAADRGLAFA